MIQVKRLDGQDMILNAELIFSIQKTPDTLICFTTGERLMVQEEMKEDMDKVMLYRRTVNTAPPIYWIKKMKHWMQPTIQTPPL